VTDSGSTSPRRPGCELQTASIGITAGLAIRGPVAGSARVHHERQQRVEAQSQIESVRFLANNVEAKPRIPMVSLEPLLVKYVHINIFNILIS
jgi:hypothetical protein